MTWFSFASGTKVEASNGTHHVNAQSTTVAVLETSKAAASSGQTPTLGDKTKATVSTTQQTVVTIAESQPGKSRRFSRQSFTFVRKQSIKNASPSTIEERDEQAPKTAQKQPQQKVSKSDKLAKQSALAMRSIVVGSASEAPKVSAAALKPELKKIKTQLLEPKTANKLITQLRQLPALDENHSAGPIHAVCLGHSDADENTLHFSKLVSDTPGSVSGDVSTFAFPDISDSIDKLAKLYQDMHVIDLIKVSDFGLGQPGDGEGLLAGALPTAQTVLEGVRQITPELMALGFATGKAITPDHTGIFPPTDRISVLTYWWGLELLLPTPSLAYLSSAQSITNTVMNFLSALALVNNGVREILPFIRYIAQFIDFEFNTIRGQDRGQGVVCAATWIMPAALVPRPWDFPAGPPPKALDNNDAAKADTAKRDTAGGDIAKGKTGEPKLTPSPGIAVPPAPSPKPISSILDIVAEETTDTPTPTPAAKPSS